MQRKWWTLIAVSVATFMLLLVVGSFRRFRVDADRLVAVLQQRRYKAAQRSAANLQHPRRRRRQLTTYERPHRS